jgi:hypothetical protein
VFCVCAQHPELFVFFLSFGRFASLLFVFRLSALPPLLLAPR